MKSLVAYSSLTGNTKAVAEAVAKGLGEGASLVPVKEAPAPEGFDLVVVGFYVDKGKADADSLRYLEGLKGRKAAFLFTLGAYPDSPHADKVEEGTRELLAKGGNEVLGCFRSQGKVDPGLIEVMKKKLGPDHPHAQMTEERKALLEEASKHPDSEDIKRAEEFGVGLLSRDA
ncbi:MAG: flavodoxin family protein [Deltaproteobacteria bacterium]|jgi:flavodoxin|nr:flavodoxin family protein [Deltaproteobacteria bacterium]